MQAALAETNIAAPAVPVIANVRAAPVIEPEEIRQLLVEQITARVRWRESMIWLADNDAGNLVELGNGKVLAGMARRIDPRLTATALSTPDDIRAYLEENQGD
jgi:[acyl-carrier-protein] S-malonyltransferase